MFDGNGTPRKVVAYSADPWESACPVLRATGPAQVAGWSLVQGNDWRNSSISISLDPIAEADLVLILRDFPRYVEHYERIVAHARRLQKPVVYDLDDLLIELPPDHPDSRHYREARGPMLLAAAEADAVTVSTPALRDYLAPYAARLWVLPNYLNDRLWPVRDRAPAGGADAPLVIGYMGSGTHSEDLRMIVPVLRRLLERSGARVVLRFFGRAAPPPELASLANVEWAQFHFLDYARFVAHFSQQQCDVFIAPLRDTPFNRCKSWIKFLEYSALGVPGVYSRVPPYEAVVEHGKNGLLAGSLEEWEEALGKLVEDATLRVELGNNALLSVRGRWLLSDHAGEWTQAYGQILAASSQPGPARVPVSVVRKLQAWQQETDRELAERERQLAQARLTIETLNAQNEHLQSTLRQVFGSITWRGTEPIRQAYARVQALQQRIAAFRAGSRPEEGAAGKGGFLPGGPDSELTGAAEVEPLQAAGEAATEPARDEVAFTERGFFWTNERYLSVTPLPASGAVDIIVCVGGREDLIARCINALRRETAPDTYRLHLVVHEHKAHVLPPDPPPGTQVVTHTMELFNFARANNLVLAHCPGDAVLLNDDTEVTAGWLEQLRRDARGVALTGAHTGFQCSGNPDMWGKSDRKVTWYPINMFCAYIPARIRQVVGLLDEEFSYYGGEDVDYSCRALQHGFPLVVSSAYVHHMGNQSFGEKKQRLMAESDKIILERYGVAAPFELSSIKPLVSVVTATRNRAHLLPAAARSILDGLYPNLELIIVDDMSSDGTWEVIGELQRADERVIGIRMPKSVGAVKARQVGIDAAKGQFVAFMDDDDVAWPNRISALLQELMLRPDLDVVYGGFEVVSDGKRERGRTRPFDVQAYLQMKFDIGSGVLLMRRQVAATVPFLSAYQRAIDYDWVFRLVRRGYKIDYCPAVVLDYNRIGPPGSHLAGNQESIQQHRAIQEREELLNELRTR